MNRSPMSRPAKPMKRTAFQSNCARDPSAETRIEPRKCSQCPREFYPRSSLHDVCSQRCAMRKIKAKDAQAKADFQARKDAVKPRAKWLAECQAIVNKIVRLRDRNKPCCSCDRPATWDGQWHASHFRSVGAAPGLRFHLWNIERACSICNNHLSGNLAQYLPRKVARDGQARVDWLYAQNGKASHSVEYLRRFKAVMGKRLRRIEKLVKEQS